MESDTVEHNGGCHCRRVRWRVQAPSSVVAWQCNCSDCSMRGNISFIIPSHTAKHTFCKGLSMMLRLSTMMGLIGKAHTNRQALLHALKVRTEGPLFLQPLSSASLPKETKMKFLLYILSLWKSAPTCPLLSFVLGLAFFSLRSHENPLQFLFNVNDINDPIKKKTWISSSSAEIAGELQFIKAGH